MHRAELGVTGSQGGNTTSFVSQQRNLGNHYCNCRRRARLHRPQSPADLGFFLAGRARRRRHHAPDAPRHNLHRYHSPAGSRSHHRILHAANLQRRIPSQPRRVSRALHSAAGLSRHCHFRIGDRRPDRHQRPRNQSGLLQRLHSCAVGFYNVSTATNLPGAPTHFPLPPNSLMFDPRGRQSLHGQRIRRRRHQPR